MFGDDACQCKLCPNCGQVMKAEVQRSEFNYRETTYWTCGECGYMIRGVSR